ncbi:MAG: hypothetical protein NT067_06485 [Candidatus Diapherotrites archaeon]|nr:hypothetical protein [Candidatus Diapherotrites archaeon]
MSGKSGCRGQAALTDAIFLLVVSSCLAALMFFFITGTTVKTDTGFQSPTGTKLASVKSSSYGSSVERIALEFYGTDFATSALQTLLYSSTPRRYNETLANAQEIDYLLAFLKEDYANYRVLGEQSKKLLLKDMNTVMASAISNYDFLLVLRTQPASGDISTFVFVLLKYTEVSGTTGKPEIKYYFCSPDRGKEEFIQDEFLSQAGSVIKSQPVVLRFRYREGGITADKDEKILTELAMWPSMKLEKELITNKDDLNCTVVG